MTKDSAKDRILTHAAQIIHKKGFNNTGIQEILESAGVPKGSFYFYFKSKEDLGLALIDHYAERFGSMWRKVLGASEMRQSSSDLRDFSRTLASCMSKMNGKADAR